jgi:hypothetical protein
MVPLTSLLNTELATTPPSWGSSASDGKSYVNELRDTIARESPNAFDAIRSERFPVADFNKLTRTPAAFGNETSPSAFYTNQYRAEEMIRGDLGAGGSGVSKNLLAQAKLLGYTEEYMKALHAATVSVEKVNGESIATFTPTDARARLRDMGPTDETTARRLQAAQSQTETAAMLKANGGGDIVGNYRVLNGEAYKLTTLGAERVKNGLLEEQIRFGRGGGSLLNSLGGQVASAASFTLGYGALFGAIGADQGHAARVLRLPGLPDRPAGRHPQHRRGHQRLGQQPRRPRAGDR